MKNEVTSFVYGINPVFEILRAERRKAKKVLLEKGRVSEKIREILTIADKKGVAIEWKDKKELDDFSSSANHQGVICLTIPFPLKESVGFLSSQSSGKNPPIYIILDKINDPMNLGAIIRSSVIAGIDGIIIPKHGSCPITAAVAKASAGSLEYASIIRQTNMVNVINEMKKNNIWVFAVDEKGSLPYTEVDFTVPVALVFGSEGKGIRQLVRKSCDETMYIPSKGSISSLNVSAAFSVIVFEAIRQRESKKLKPDS